MFYKKINLIMKWKTTIIAVDVTTGEVITKKRVLNKEFIVINKEFKYEINESKTIGTKHIKWICEPNRQLNIF